MKQPARKTAEQYEGGQVEAFNDRTELQTLRKPSRTSWYSSFCVHPGDFKSPMKYAPPLPSILFKCENYRITLRKISIHLIKRDNLT